MIFHFVLLACPPFAQVIAMVYALLKASRSALIPAQLRAFGALAPRVEFEVCSAAALRARFLTRC